MCIRNIQSVIAIAMEIGVLRLSLHQNSEQCTQHIINYIYSVGRDVSESATKSINCQYEVLTGRPLRQLMNSVTRPYLAGVVSARLDMRLYSCPSGYVPDAKQACIYPYQNALAGTGT